jgi:hypothetical protein
MRWRRAPPTRRSSSTGSSAGCLSVKSHRRAAGSAHARNTTARGASSTRLKGCEPQLLPKRTIGPGTPGAIVRMGDRWRSAHTRKAPPIGGAFHLWAFHAIRDPLLPLCSFREREMRFQPKTDFIPGPNPAGGQSEQLGPARASQHSLLQDEEQFQGETTAPAALRSGSRRLVAGSGQAFVLTPARQFTSQRAFIASWTVLKESSFSIADVKCHESFGYVPLSGVVSQS